VPSKSASRIRRILRTIAWALFAAFVFGFVVGSLIRKRLEEPVRYIGDRERPAHSIASAALTTGTIPTRPGDIGHAATGILVARQHEEKI